MALASNKLLPVLGVLGVVLVVAVGWRAFSGGNGGTAKPQQMTALPKTTAADADSPAETIKSMAADVIDLKQTARSNEEKIKDVLAQKEAIQRELTTKQEAALQQQQEANKSVFNRMKSQLDEVTAQLSQLSSRKSLPGGGDIPVGLGLDGMGGGVPAGENTHVVWIEPMDSRDADPKASAGGGALQKASLQINNATGPARRLLNDGAVEPVRKASIKGKNGAEGVLTTLQDKVAGSASGQGLHDSRQPRYTVPKNATLLRATAFTAMVGRIPVNGEVKDPMPFKVLVGAKNLAANGLDVPPELEGAVFSGVAIGDFTLRCSQGKLLSVTFLFSDGTILTQDGGPASPLGTISDKHGIPCVSGRLITNAPVFLAERIAALAVETAGSTYAASQFSTQQTALGGTASALTGSLSDVLLGRTISSGASEIRRWVEERQKNSFDAIFVEPGEEVALHIDEELHIDFDPNGRKLRHEKPIEGAHSASLD